MLEVDRLGKRYGSRWVFRGLSFRLEVGDRLVVLGRNGSGKSTLLKVLAGLIPLTEGAVTLPEGDARRTVALSALDQALYPQLSFAEHLRLAADLRGCDSRTDELIDFVGLREARDLPTAQMSTGMRARVRMALAVQARPGVLLLDEPGASLDEAGRALVERIVEAQTRYGCLVVATNEPQERRLATLELELAA
ncbi:MAG: ABC transporter ATP-binding protein [Fimbriimonas sp.]